MSTTNTAPAPTPTAEKFLTQSQVYAGIRYAGTIVASGGSVVALLGILPPDTAHSLVAALQKALTDLQNLIGDFYVIAGILGPIAAVWITKRGVNSASPQAQIVAVQSLPEAQVSVSDPRLQVLPDVKVVAKAAALIAVLLTSLALAMPSPAMAQLKKPAITGNPIEDIKTDLNGGATPAAGQALTGNAQKDAIALWKKIQGAATADIAYAILMAKAANTAAPAGITTGAGMRLSCLMAIQTLNQQANGANLKDSNGAVIARPDPALFTDAETLAEVIDAVQPGGPLWTSCSGAAQLAATNTVAFINALVSGAAGLAVLAPK